MTGTASGARVYDIEAGIDGLLARHEERIVFLHPAWLRTWFTEFGDRYEPVFLTNDDCSALAPLMRDDSRLTFIGDSEVVDFMDIVCADPSPNTYASIWESICAEDWTQLDLWGLKEPTPTREAIASLAKASGCEVREELEAVAPRVWLPPSWDEYLAGLSKKDRHELRRKMRRFLDSGANIRFEVLQEQSDVLNGIEEFLRLHTISRQDKADFMSGQMPGFFRRMASAMSAAGLVRLFLLYADEKPVASVFCFDAGSSLYMYNSGYDPEFSSFSVGLVSKAMCLQWAIEQGKKSLDFLRGNEAYKYDLGAKDQQIHRLIVSRSQ